MFIGKMHGGGGNGDEKMTQLQRGRSVLSVSIGRTGKIGKMFRKKKLNN